jgi:3-deoxy-D-manno-octulosonate 8-phosphate phosphatase (KDO 8-P phosphatase)
MQTTSACISHRGNLDGANPDLENQPDYVLTAASSFMVEVDAWMIDQRYWLGHDKPLYEVDRYFFFDSNILTHCKTIDTFLDLSRFPMADAFFQGSELVVKSSQGHLILHSSVRPSELALLPPKTIWASPEWRFTEDEPFPSIQVITDYAGLAPPIGSHQLFDLLILDVDGVLTDGRKIYDGSGKSVMKQFCDRDFTAIKRFQSAGVNVCFLSADRVVNEPLARERGVDFMYARMPDGNIDKELRLRELRDRYKARTTAYIGDDYFDLTLLSAVDLSACPADASSEIKATCDIVLSARGGEGVIAEFYERQFEGARKRYTRDRPT